MTASEHHSQRRPPFDAETILIGAVVVPVLGSVAISLVLAILFVVGETVEHFTP